MFNSNEKELSYPQIIDESTPAQDEIKKKFGRANLSIFKELTITAVEYAGRL